MFTSQIVVSLHLFQITQPVQNIGFTTAVPNYLIELPRCRVILAS